MNKQNKRFVPAFDPVLKTIDLVITEEELNLLVCSLHPQNKVNLPKLW